MKRFARPLFNLLLMVFILLNVVVAFHAYKFTHFYDHGEIVFKAPANKTSWDKTRELFFGFNFSKQKNENPDTIVQTFYLTTARGLKLEAWHIPTRNARGTVALFHGHGGKKSSVLGEAAAFRSMGYNTVLLDFRAHGNSDGNTCTIGYKEAEDIRLVYDHLSKGGEKNIVLWGISMGAASITKAINDYQLLPSRVILEMPFGTMEDAVEGRIKLMGLPAEPISTLLTFWGGTENGFWAYGYKPEEYVRKIKSPVLVQWGQKDPRVTESETQRIYANISTKKKFVVYENSGHESLYKKESRKWVSEVTEFLQ